MIKRLFVIAFGLGFGAAAWQNVPPVENATGEALGLALAVALVVAFVAGRRFGPERDAAAVAAAVAASISQARSEAAAQARAQATQVVYVDNGGGEVIPFDRSSVAAVDTREVDAMEAQALVKDNLGLDLPYEQASDLLSELVNADPQRPTYSETKTDPA